MLRRARAFERVCDRCGYTWTLSRWQAKLSSRRPAVVGFAIFAGDDAVRRSQFRRREDVVESRAELIARFTHCQRCGASTYTERRLAGPPPALD